MFWTGWYQRDTSTYTNDGLHACLISCESRVHVQSGNGRLRHSTINNENDYIERWLQNVNSSNKLNNKSDPKIRTTVVETSFLSPQCDFMNRFMSQNDWKVRTHTYRERRATSITQISSYHSHSFSLEHTVTQFNSVTYTHTLCVCIHTHTSANQSTGSI